MGGIWKVLISSCLFAICLLVVFMVMTKVSRSSKEEEAINLLADDYSDKAHNYVQHSEEDLSCKFGFDFLHELSNSPDTDEVQRLLPAHTKQNFSGALVTQNLMCLDTLDSTVNQLVGIFECHGQGRNQAIQFTTNGFLQTGGNKPLCISIKNMISQNVVLKTCNILDETQFWTTDSILGHIKPITRQNYCLSSPNDLNDAIFVDSCNNETNLQKWQLILQDVLSLLISDISKKKVVRKGTNRQMKNILLQKPTKKIRLLDEILFS